MRRWGWLVGPVLGLGLLAAGPGAGAWPLVVYGIRAVSGSVLPAGDAATRIQVDFTVAAGDGTVPLPAPLAAELRRGSEAVPVVLTPQPDPPAGHAIYVGQASCACAGPGWSLTLPLPAAGLAYTLPAGQGAQGTFGSWQPAPAPTPAAPRAPAPAPAAPQPRPWPGLLAVCLAGAAAGWLSERLAGGRARAAGLRP
jgi:hypothetical protein